jgi:small subunit ribosomal protein S20
MPVTKTAKRALRSAKRKEVVNKRMLSKLEASLRLARRGKSKEKIMAAISMVDKVAKRKVIHKNKASRLKSSLQKLLKGKKVSKTKAAK